jgi:ADP-ribose pyrophosphatase YjhB (NUDIX family)
MEERSALDLSEQRKRRFSSLVRGSAVLRFGLSVVARIMAPRQPVGAVGVVFDEKGRVLLVEHVFRTDFPWGLPGGWVERGEDPARTVMREIREELGLTVDVGRLLLSARVGLAERSTHPPHLGLAYSCRLTGGTFKPAREVVSCTWAHPGEIHQELAPFQRQAISIAAEGSARGEMLDLPVGQRS